MLNFLNVKINSYQRFAVVFNSPRRRNIEGWRLQFCIKTYSLKGPCKRFIMLEKTVAYSSFPQPGQTKCQKNSYLKQMGQSNSAWLFTWPAAKFNPTLIIFFIKFSFYSAKRNTTVCSIVRSIILFCLISQMSYKLLLLIKEFYIVT